MYGKFFASTYTGSMFGAGADVFAVWGYVIANTVNAQVELNPRLLSAVLGTPEDRIAAAVDFLCSPDAKSRSKVEDGKRLIREGEFAYRVPTFFNYRSIRNEDERREYNRKKKAEQRTRDKNVKDRVIDSRRVSNMSAHTEAEAEADTDKENLIREIAKFHPRIADPLHLSHERATAILEALARHGDKVLAGMQAHRKAYDLSSPAEKKFFPSPERFFRNSEYLLIPEVKRADGFTPPQNVDSEYISEGTKRKRQIEAAKAANCDR
jgi:hypothetical protein